MRRKEPTPGWKSSEAFANPRPPAVPATLDLTLEEYFGAAALMGLMSAQHGEPNKGWASRWALDLGEAMASEARRRRHKR